MSERKPLTPEQREAKNRRARERRAAAKTHTSPEELKADADFLKRYGTPSPAQEHGKPQQDDALPTEAGKDINLKPRPTQEEPLERKGIPTDPRVKVAPPKEPRYLASQADNTVYTNPKHPDNKGEFRKVGVLYRHKGPDGKMKQDIIAMGREPANKKERRKAKAGLPFRDKTGVVA